MIEEVFVTQEDSDTHRVCGTCAVLKELSEFYRDGTDGNGKTKYRRDCKLCYKTTRMQSAKQKAKLSNKKGGRK